MTTSQLTLNDFNGKFFSIKAAVTVEVLDLINKSETMKAQIRAYQVDLNTKDVFLDIGQPDAGSYTTPKDGNKGFLAFGANTISTAADFIRFVSHELGHYSVEGPGGAVTSARASAAGSQNVEAYEAACHLTEGYARLATAQVVAEIASSSTPSSTLFKLTHLPEYEQYRSLSPIAAQTSWTWADVNNALAYALGESNKTNETSTTNESYLVFCRRQADSVINSGTNTPIANAPASVIGDSATETDWPDQRITTFTADGTSITTFVAPDSSRITELHAAPTEAQYAAGEMGDVLQRFVTTRDDTGNTLVITTHADGSGTARALDSAGHLINEVPIQRDGGIDGTTGTATETIDDKEVVLGVDFNTGKITGIESVNGSAALGAAQIDAALQAAGITTSDLIQNRRLGELIPLVTVADPNVADGMRHVIYPPDFAWSSDPASQAFAASLSSIQSLIAGLQSGKPLPTATGLFGLGATFTGAQALVQAGDALGVVNALVNLRDIFERGDVMSGLYNGAVLSSSALKLYKAALAAQTELVNAQALNQISDLAAEIAAVDTLIQGLGQAIPLLSLVTAVQRGDALGAASAGLAYLNAIGQAWAGPVGWMVAAIQIGRAFLQGPVFQDGAVYETSALGGYWPSTIVTDDQHGGGSVAQAAMHNLIDAIVATWAAVEGGGEPFGIIGERLPELRYFGTGNYGAYTLYYRGLHGDMGYYARTFDADGNFVKATYEVNPYGASGEMVTGQDAPNGEAAQSEDFFQSLGQQFVERAYAAGAIAPTWMVQTVAEQAALGHWEPALGYLTDEFGNYLIDGNGNPVVDPDYQVWVRDAKAWTAGFDTSRLAVINGWWLGQGTGDASPGNVRGNTQASQQNAGVIVLDLGGDGVPVGTREQGLGVLLDVDDDGFAEHTAWINPRDGVLVIDWNGDGRIEGGHEMFSDAGVDMAARGLHALDEIDANRDGVIDALDPAYHQLRYWQDINHDGVVQRGELYDPGALDINTGQWTRSDGSIGSFSVVSLQADVAGVITKAVGLSLLELWETGDTRMRVSGVRDYASAAGTPDGEGHVRTTGTLTTADESMDGMEDVVLRVGAAQLLQNDHGSGALSLQATGNVIGGTLVTEDGGQVLVFTPTANFNGRASFSYVVVDQAGSSSTATAYIDVVAVRDSLDASNAFDQRHAGWDDLTVSEQTQGEGAMTILTFRLPADAVLGTPVANGAGISAFWQTEGHWIGYRDGVYYWGTASTGGTQPAQWQAINLQSPDSGTISVGGHSPAGGYTYEVLNAPRFGVVDILDSATGRWHYSGEGSYTRGSDGIYRVPDDAFVVRVTDAEGQFTDIKIDVATPDEDNTNTWSPGDTGGNGDGGGGGALPIVLDLAGDGFQFISADDSKAFYDFPGDAERERTGWVGPRDGLLAFDANDDGHINLREEIQFTGYVPGATTDLAGLTAFDTNHDGRLSSTDAQWSRFFVWQDLNGDGEQTPAELRSLAQWGIAAISLSSDGVERHVEGNAIHGIGSFTRIDGSTSALADVGFSVSEEAYSATPDDNLTAAPEGGLISSGAGADTVQGGAGADDIRAGAGNDVVTGDDGDDAVQGDAGDDLIDGGTGGDTLWGDGGVDVVWGGEGRDEIHGGTGSDRLYGDDGDDLLFGDGGNDMLTGDGGDDVLVGGSGVDAMYGGDGNDRLDGGSGADRMQGGSGNDVYFLDNAQDVVIESDWYGDPGDIIMASADVESTRGVEIVMLVGAAAKVVNGDAHANKLFGNQADNVLAGGAGADLMEGGAGDDRYVVDDEGDVVIEWASGAPMPVDVGGIGADNSLEANFFNSAGHVGFSGGSWGIDTVEASISYTLGANVEALVLVGYAPLNGTGNELDNELTGNANANVLDGADGDDLLRGGGGADVLIGGGGSNTYVFDSMAGSVVVRPTAGEVGRLQFDGLELADLTFAYVGDDLLISMGTGNQVLVEGYRNQVEMQTGWQLSVGGADHVLGDLLKLHAAMPLADQTINEASPFTWTVPTGAFVDLLAGAGNPPVLSATLASGAALPSWLHFDAASRTFSGTPGDADVAALTIRLTAVDFLGNSATSQVNIRVENVNQAPVLSGPVARPNVTPLRDWHYVLPAATFADPDAGDVLHYSAARADGSPLPGWLNFDAATRTFSGMASPTDAGLLALRVTATDTAGASVNLAFEIKVLAGQAFRGTASDDVLTANIGSDTLNGLAGNDTLIGLSGNDSLVGGTGIDSMAGGAGDDIYDVDDAGDLVIEAADSGQDLVKSSISYVLPEQIEDLTLIGTAAIDATGNAGDNVIRGNAMANRIDGAAGADSMLGGNGDDTYLVDNEGDTVTESGGVAGGIDTVLASVNFALGGSIENMVLTGAQDLHGWGNSQANALMGNAGANWLDGGSGIDTLVGGAGDDGYGVDNVDDVVVETQDGGTDTVEASVNYTLSDWVENLTLTGTRAINATGNQLDNTLHGNAAANRLDGGAGADTMSGLAGNDVYVVDNVGDVVVEDADSGIDTVETNINYTLGESVERLTLVGTNAIEGTGNSLANTLTGNAASNRLDGGAGADNMAGGEGDDSYLVDNTGDVVTELAGGGFDTVYSLITYKLRPELEKLILDGASAINGTGNELANVLVGNQADNRLDGGLGADTLMGGAGNDTYVVDDVGDTVTELAGDGLDLVESGISYVLGGELENLTLTGSAAIDATGNALANTLKGNSGGNRLDGGLGADTMIGGTGNDVFVVDDLGDVVIESGSGTDRVESSVSFVLGANIEALVLTGVADSDGTGNTLANTITGNGGSNRLNGGTGADTMQGGAGSDTYVVDNVGDLVIESADGGIDTVESSLTYTLGGDLENLTLTGTSAINGTGNELANALTGNAGANRLDGGAGTDTLSGGAGNDVYVVDASDVVIEADGEGVDTVESALSYTLGAFVEKLVLTGTGAIDGLGNGLANTLTGSAGDNVLDGGAGADTMVGGLGNDTYCVENAADVTTEAASAGTDTVISTITWKLGTNLENLTLVGSANIDATGNTAANVLTGNDGNNVLSGGTGADSMAGGLGDDTYVVDVATDVVTEAVNAGTDWVQSAVTWALGANLENLSLTGTGAINGTGNTLDNVLTGNNGKNVLNGGAGNDTLDGGLGLDTLDGGSGNDLIILSTTPATGNVDTIQNFSVTDDTIQLQRATFSALPGTEPGPLDAAAFWTGTSAHDADDRIVFDSATGKLWYDVDGIGATAAVQIAVLVGVVGTLTAADFLTT